MGRTVLAHGVLTYEKDNHWGFTTETPVMLKVVGGDWKIEP
jgi:branched-chain amino acid transport system substrate-binding protein